MNRRSSRRAHARRAHAFAATWVAVGGTALAACSGGDGGAAAIDLAADAVIDVTPIPDVLIFAPLSGDGQQIASPTGSEVCVLQVETGASRCAEFGSAPWPESFRFSPDGSRVLVIDDFVRQLNEPDIHVLDVATMELTALTDDGIDAVELGDDAAPDGRIDLAATWMPDGSVVFVRSTGVDGDAVLMRVAADEREPVEVSGLAGIGPVDLVFPLTAIADDAVAGITSPRSGGAALVQVDLDSGDIETITEFDERDGVVQLIDLDRDAGVALVASTTALERGRTDLPTHALVDIESGGITNLLEGVVDADGNQIRTVTAALTPDGTGIVFGRYDVDRLGLYTVATEAAIGAAGDDDITRVGELPAALDGVDVLGWNPAVPMVWADDTTLVARVGLDAVARVTFAEAG